MEQRHSLAGNCDDGEKSEREAQGFEDMPETLTDTQALHEEQFHLLDQNGQPIQYDLQSLGNSTAQMTGMEQVAIPQEPFADEHSPQG
uniref:Calcium response factor n=1 Tax=Mus musculus TaxID=10090 RepID=M0QWJ8_MOUSE